MTTFIPFIQIGLSLLLITLILIQQSDAGLGSAFGSDDGGVRRTRRGAEQMIFTATIVVAILFTVSAIAALVLR
ncbi:preprotein translocase subunit SecG [Candidatus Campbellbacteria bacterium]|nr:MAG: preprotein translocase subunit SecG [Candidatus Campbellbacteria bacterium]